MYLCTYTTNSDWTTVAQAALQVNLIAVINPASGPGNGDANNDDNYKFGIQVLSTSGAQVIGYVPTTFGMRNINDVFSDIDKYASWSIQYRVQGIFFDEAANSADPAVVEYYRKIYQYAKRRFGCKGKYITNQGTKTPEVYLTGNRATDSAVIFESYYSPDWINYSPDDSYVANHADTEFAAIIHSCPAGDLSNAFDFAVQRNIGMIYITDDVMDNPYDSLPSYFNQLVDLVKNA